MILSRLPKKEKDKIDFGAKPFDDQMSVKRLTHLIREEKPFFEPRIVPEDLRSIICVRGIHDISHPIRRRTHCIYCERSGLYWTLSIVT